VRFTGARSFLMEALRLPSGNVNLALRLKKESRIHASAPRCIWEQAVPSEAILPYAQKINGRAINLADKPARPGRPVCRPQLFRRALQGASPRGTGGLDPGERSNKQLRR